MWTIAEDIIREARTLGIPVDAINSDAADRVHTELRDRYGRAGNRWPLWDAPNCDPSFQEEEAWRHLPAFLSNAACLVLWEPRTERKVLRFRCAKDLVKVLEECHRTEFYVTDDLSYMVCFNEHDFLIASGRAAEWLRSYMKPPEGSRSE
jgi:hypothetical protein